MTRMKKAIARGMVIGLAALALGLAPDPTTARVHAWRTAHERQVLGELFDLLSIPNVASSKADIQRNAEALVAMLKRRRFAADIVPTKGSPLVFAERKVPGATRTLAFYFHYDGQPVVASEWSYNPPFSPVIVAPHPPAGRTISLDTFQGPIYPEWRIYARSASDDKSPIVALLAALDALDAEQVPLTAGVRLVL